MLQQLVLITLKFQMFLQNVVQCCVWHVKLSGSMTGWFVWTVNKSRTNCIHPSFSDWSSSGAFSLTNAASLIKQFIPLVNQHFCWRFPSKHHMKSPLHCNCRHRLMKTWHAFSFFCLKCHFNNCDWRFGNSSGTVYKFHHITYWNVFSFHSSAFRFMSNVTVKWYTFHA
jgi:hypothetical protein